MKDVIVTMAVSSIRGMLTEYILRLSSAGITVNVDNIEEVRQFLGREHQFSISVKLATLRFIAKRFSGYEFIVTSDGWDVNFYGNREELISRIPREGVLWAAEKNCWPNADLAEMVPDNGPWKYVNGGLLAGTPKSIMEMCDRIEAHPLYDPNMIDQEFMNLLLSGGSEDFTLDWKTNLFFCLHGGHDELEFRWGMPYNKVHKTWPLFVHANGNWPVGELVRKHDESLKVTLAVR